MSFISARSLRGKGSLKLLDFSITKNLLVDHCIIREKARKAKEMIFVITNFIFGRSLAIITNCSIVVSTKCFLASS